MSTKEEPRIFVGGLSWDTDERQLQEVFSRFGKVVDAQFWAASDGNMMHFQTAGLVPHSQWCLVECLNCDSEYGSMHTVYTQQK